MQVPTGWSQAWDHSGIEAERISIDVSAGCGLKIGEFSRLPKRNLQSLEERNRSGRRFSGI